MDVHRAALETCVYCPKLCRAACPVSNVEHTETVTPWGKMSLAYFGARSDVPVDREHADPSWACSGCFGCREKCDHKNDVASTLMAARSEAFARGAAPEPAARVAEGFQARAVDLARAVGELQPEARSSSQPAILVGCAYVRRAPDVARDALRVTEVLSGAAHRAVRACCGLPLLHAGDHDGFVRAATAMARELAEAPSVVVVDPGCARALAVEYPKVGVRVPRVQPFIDLAASQVSRLQPGQESSPLSSSPSSSRAVRWHDPCQLGRGMDRYEEPREVLTYLLGKPPLEFRRSRGDAECSGGGGLLPVTRPETARAMASARVEQHRAEGGGTIVTACAQSLHRFRRAGESVEDIVSLIARALPR